MASPIVIGTTASVVVPINKNRAVVRFQNVGSSNIFIKKIPLEGAYSVVSHTDFEIDLFPASSSQEGGEAFETNSIASFMAVGTGATSLAIYETNKV